MSLFDGSIFKESKEALMEYREYNQDMANRFIKSAISKENIDLLKKGEYSQLLREAIMIKYQAIVHTLNGDIDEVLDVFFKVFEKFGTLGIEIVVFNILLSEDEVKQSFLDLLQKSYGSLQKSSRKLYKVLSNQKINAILTFIIGAIVEFIL